MDNGLVWWTLVQGRPTPKEPKDLEGQVIVRIFLAMDPSSLKSFHEGWESLEQHLVKEAELLYAEITSPANTTELR